MTRLDGIKSVTRETQASLHRGRPLVVTVDSLYIHIREKGRRTPFTIPIEAVFTFAAKKQAEAARRLKIEARRKKGGS